MKEGSDKKEGREGLEKGPERRDAWDWKSTKRPVWKKSPQGIQSECTKGDEKAISKGNFEFGKKRLAECREINGENAAEKDETDGMGDPACLCGVRETHDVIVML